MAKELSKQKFKERCKHLLNFINVNKGDVDKHLDLWGIVTYSKGKSSEKEETSKKTVSSRREILKDYFDILNPHELRKDFIDFYVTDLIKGIANKDKKTDSLCSAIDIVLGVYQDSTGIIRSPKDDRPRYDQLTEIRKKAVGDRKINESSTFKPVLWSEKKENKKNYFEHCLKNYEEILKNSSLSDDEQEEKYNETLKKLDEWKVFGKNNYFQTKFGLEKKIKIKKRKVGGGKNKMENGIISYGLAVVGGIGVTATLFIAGLFGELGKTNLEKAVESEQKKEWVDYDVSSQIIIDNYSIDVKNPGKATLNYFANETNHEYVFHPQIIKNNDGDGPRLMTAETVAQKYINVIRDQLTKERLDCLPENVEEYLEIAGQYVDQNTDGTAFGRYDLTLPKLNELIKSFED